MNGELLVLIIDLQLCLLLALTLRGMKTARKLTVAVRASSSVRNSGVPARRVRIVP